MHYILVHLKRKMLFNSFEFLFFLIAVLIGYYLLRKRVKYMFLLIASYWFYINWNPKYIILLIFSTVTTYLCGRLIDKEKKISNAHKKTIISICIIANLSILFYYKYFDFLINNIQRILSKIGINIENNNAELLLPIGISFYTFQTVGYILDVYRGKIRAEKDVIKYALFVSFFPQLGAGPIGRYDKFFIHEKVENTFDGKKIIEGLLTMVWGFFLKLMIADKAAIIVNTVYADIEKYGGVYLVFATILFGIQIYCDFYGYSTIAVGAARCFGYELIDNFNSPYFSKSVKEFWTRWHISLSSWFRDYLYIPLGGNRKGKYRKWFNLAVVFMVSGLWHGAAWTFIIWGALNGLYQIIGEWIKPIKRKFSSYFIEESKGTKILQAVVTFGLIDFSWIFFRASDMSEAVMIIKSIARTRNWTSLIDDSIFNLGLNWKNFVVLVIAILVLVLADYVKYKGISISKKIAEQDSWFIILILSVSISIIFVFGHWGGAFDASSFIYSQF